MWPKSKIETKTNNIKRRQKQKRKEKKQHRESHKTGNGLCFYQLLSLIFFSSENHISNTVPIVRMP